MIKVPSKYGLGDAVVVPSGEIGEVRRVTGSFSIGWPTCEVGLKYGVRVGVPDKPEVLEEFFEKELALPA